MAFSHTPWYLSKKGTHIFWRSLPVWPIIWRTHVPGETHNYITARWRQYHKRRAPSRATPSRHQDFSPRQGKGETDWNEVCTSFHSTLLYSTLLYSTLLYSTLLYSTLLYATLYSTLLYFTLLSTLLDSSTLLYTALSLLYSTSLF